MASNDEFVIEFEVEENGSAQKLADVEKQGKRTQRALSSVSSEASKTTNTIARSFRSLITKLASLGAAIALARFARNLADANLKLRNLAQTSGNSAKSIRALQMAFKALGYAENSANAGIESFTKSIADYKYKGELSGQMEAFNRIGIQVMDSKGKARDYYEVLVETGEKAIKNFRGDTNEASLYLKSLGFSQEQITLMLDKNARANMKTNKESAATSDKAAEAAEKLNQSIIQLQETFGRFVLNIEERFGIFETLIKLLNTISNWCSGRPSETVLAFFKGLGEILDAIETTVVALINTGKMFNDYVIQPIVKVLDLVGEVISKVTGEEYKSKESWTGDGKPILEKNTITGERNYQTPAEALSSYSASGNSGGSPGSSSGGFSYASSGDAGTMTASALPVGAESAFNTSIAETFAKNFGTKYALDGLHDCAAYVRKIGQAIIKNNPDMFDKSDSKLFNGVSENIVENLEKRAGGFLANSELDPSRVKSGTIIGMDTGDHKWDRGRKYGVDHIVAVYRDPKTGKMMVTQSSPWNYNAGKKDRIGVQTMEYDRWYAKSKKHRLFAVNMGAFSKNTTIANAAHSVNAYSSGAAAISTQDQMANVPVVQKVEKDSHNQTFMTLIFGGKNIHQAVGKNISSVHG